MSPRKSSTSSGRPAAHRSRYLGLEVAGELLPPPTPRGWEATLGALLDARSPRAVRFRVVRAEGRRAVVEVSNGDLPLARSAWNVAPDGRAAPAIVSRRTWGTLVGAKKWLREAGAQARR